MKATEYVCIICTLKRSLTPCQFIVNFGSLSLKIEKSAFRCRKVSEVFVFEATNTKTPKFSATFDLKLHGKARAEDKFTD